MTGYRARIAEAARDWPAATALLTARIVWNRGRAAAALAASPTSLTTIQRTQITNLVAGLGDLGDILANKMIPAAWRTITRPLS